MKPLASVLYEDKMIPTADKKYPLHDLVMRMVEDDIDGQTYKLLKLTKPYPKNGIDALLAELQNTDRIAGAGKLCLLADRDRVASHLGLAGSANDEEIVKAVEAKSNAPGKLHVFFLYRNVESLLRDIQRCGNEPINGMDKALKKDRNARDTVLNEAKKTANKSLRDCLRNAQQGLDGLAKAIAAVVPPAEIA